MFNRDKEPPALGGFSSRGTGRRKSLSSPTTSIWLAIIFVAMIFALMSVRKNIRSAENAMKPPENRHSGWIVDTPENVEEMQPPPDPETLFPSDDDVAETIQESIELKKEERSIPLRPIDLAIDIQIPKDAEASNVQID